MGQDESEERVQGQALPRLTFELAQVRMLPLTRHHPASSGAQGTAESPEAHQPFTAVPSAWNSFPSSFSVLYLDPLKFLSNSALAALPLSPGLAGSPSLYPTSPPPPPTTASHRSLCSFRAGCGLVHFCILKAGHGA